jgi:rod shape-determining protein MreC
MQVAVERRPTLILVIVLAALFLLMSASQRTRFGGETRTMFERSVMTVFSPIPKAVNRVGEAFSDVYHGYIDMRRSVDENLALKRTVTELTGENLMLRKSYGDLARMRAILAYSEQVSMPMTLAQVIMADTAGPFKSIVLDRGSDHNIQVNDTVVTPDGLVGRVVLTTNDLSKVQLVIDGNASVGALFDRTRRQGVVRGDGGGALQMIFVPSLTDVAQGDLVVTGGIDGIYPKGIPIARVVSAEEGKDLFKRVVCRPTVDFASLEEVMVIHTRKIPAAVARYTP